MIIPPTLYPMLINEDKYLKERNKSRNSGDNSSKGLIGLIEQKKIDTKLGLKLLLEYSKEENWVPGFIFIWKYLKLPINNNCTFKGQLLEKENKQFLEVEKLIESLQ